MEQDNGECAAWAWDAWCGGGRGGGREVEAAGWPAAAGAAAAVGEARRRWPGSARGGRGGGRGPGGLQRSGAVASGLPVCYQFNLAQGCSRDVAGPNACKDAKGMHFAHACNWLDKQTNKFCLQLHALCTNH